MAWTLGLSAALTLGAALVFVIVGARFAGRGQGDDRRASRAFVIWWFGIGLYTALHAVEDVLALGGTPEVGTILMLRAVGILAAGAAFSGLCFYVLFVRTGDVRWSPRVAVYYAIATAAIVWALFARTASGVIVGAWRVDPAYSTGTATMSTILLALFTLPAIASALAYLTLARAATDAAQRRRVLVIGTGAALWLAAVTVSRASPNDALQLVTRPLAGLVFALAVAWATSRPRSPDEHAAHVERLGAREARIRELV